MPHRFVYGALARPLVLDEVLGRRFGGERPRAALAGFERLTAEGWEWPFIVPAAGPIPAQTYVAGPGPRARMAGRGP